jgi:outer membrane protein assembly factor BamB
METIRAILLSGVASLICHGALSADDWPQWMGPRRDGTWRETGVLTKFPEGGPKVQWRVEIGGGYAGPAAADGRVFVTDYILSEGKQPQPNPGARNKLQGRERILCFDAATGKPLWRHEFDCPYHVSYPAGPRVTPTVHQGKVYTLGTEGHLLCLDAAKGSVLWSKELKKEYKCETPMWGFCGHPLIDGQKLVCLVGGEGSIAVAFDKDTGKELWRALEAKEPGYCPPTLIEAGGKRQLLIWHAEAICSLDPETGKVYWEEACKPMYGMSITAPQKLGDYLFVGGIGNIGVCLKLAKHKPAVEVVWKADNKTGVCGANSTPLLDSGMIYGCDCHNGAFRGVKLETGERLWETFQPTTGGRALSHGTAFIVKNGDRYFLFSETGDLIIARLSSKGYEELSRAKILEPTGEGFGRKVVWSHPAFANKCCFARNDKELVCVSLEAGSASR